MMWVFLLSDAFTFSSLLTAYGAIRYSFSSTDTFIEEVTPAKLEADGIPVSDGRIHFTFADNLIENIPLKRHLTLRTEWKHMLIIPTISFKKWEKLASLVRLIGLLLT